MEFIDWAIVGGLVTFMVTMTLVSMRSMKSVSDFLAANRCAGKYLIAIAEGTAMTGAVAFVANFEMFYQAGFPGMWWSMLLMPISLIIGVSGWIIYRYRQTRAMTVAQFFEMRYSRNFRIFSGLIGFTAGIINFGIFPSVGSRFFIYFCGLPESFQLFGLSMSTYPVLMGILLSIALFFTLAGGQITVIITDFFQGTFCNIAFVIILVVLLIKFDWNLIIEALESSAPDASMLNPFNTTQVPDFNIWYFLIAGFGLFYTHMAWQGTQGYNCAAASPHVAKMGKILSSWKSMTQWLMFLVPAICAFTLMHHVNYSESATVVTHQLGNIENSRIQGQMTVPIALSTILPPGVMGMMCAVMFASFISIHDTYLHAWGSIFIQDVVLPFRKKPITPEKHIVLLRLSIMGVAVFVFFFSLHFRHTQHILLFFAITGSIFLGGAGAVIIGGLYWKRGTTLAAYVSMIVGASLGVGGIILDQIWSRWYGDNFPINGQWMFFISMVSSLVMYVVVSLIQRRPAFDLDRMLHRGKYTPKEDRNQPRMTVSVVMERLGITHEFSRGDRTIYFGTVVWTLGWFLVLISGSLYYWLVGISTSAWARYWHLFIWFNFAATVLVTLWLTIGGIVDAKRMFTRLAGIKRDSHDDGSVAHDDREL